LALIERCYGLCTITDGYENVRYLGVDADRLFEPHTDTRQQGIDEVQGTIPTTSHGLCGFNCTSPINLGRIVGETDVKIDSIAWKICDKRR
jgi:hypothetical protein